MDPTINHRYRAQVPGNMCSRIRVDPSRNVSGETTRDSTSASKKRRELAHVDILALGRLVIRMSRSLRTMLKSQHTSLSTDIEGFYISSLNGLND